MLGLTFVLALALSDGDKVPSLLQRVLTAHTDLGLFDPRVDLADSRDYKIEDLKGFGFWPPWVARDLDGDGKPDVVAVVVARGAEASQFGVVSIHARSPSRMHWIRPLADDTIYGVAVGSASPVVTPLYCIECDANGWYRWSGTAYEVELYVPGEKVMIAPVDHVPQLGLFSSPKIGAKVLAEVALCATVRVVRSAGNGYENRWYLVEVPDRGRLRGWIPATWVGEGCER